MTTTTFKKTCLSLLAAILLTNVFFASAQYCSCPGEIMTDAKFQSYISNYRSFFIQPGVEDKHTEWVFLSRKYFVLLDSFLKTTDYKGLRFYFVSNDRILDPNQQSRSDQIMVTIAAGYSQTEVDYDTLYYFHLEKKILRDINHTQVNLSTRTAVGTSFIGPDRILITEQTAIDNYIRENKDDSSYSRWVYICEEQIKQVREFLDSKPGYEGVKLVFGSYNELITCVGNKGIKQFTLMLAPVPTVKAKASLKEYLKFLNKFDPSYNHGELCPIKCP